MRVISKKMIFQPVLCRCLTHWRWVGNQGLPHLHNTFKCLTVPRRNTQFSLKSSLFGVASFFHFQSNMAKKIIFFGPFMNSHIFTKVKLFPGHNYRPLPPKRTGNFQRGPEIARKWPKLVTKPGYSGSIFEKTSAETRSKNHKIKKFRFYRWFRSALNHDTITCQNHAMSPLLLCNSCQKADTV